MSKVEWVRWDPNDFPAPVIRRGPHNMSGKLKRLPWAYCKRCGLMALKNDASRKALRAECVTEE